MSKRDHKSSKKSNPRKSQLTIGINVFSSKQILRYWWKVCNAFKEW